MKSCCDIVLQIIKILFSYLFHEINKKKSQSFKHLFADTISNYPYPTWFYFYLTQMWHKKIRFGLR